MILWSVSRSMGLMRVPSVREIVPILSVLRDSFCAKLNRSLVLIFDDEGFAL